MSNGAPAFLPPSTQQNGLPVQLNQLKNASTNGQPEMAIAVNGSRPASYICTYCRQQGLFQPASGSHQCQRWPECEQYEPVDLHASIRSNRLSVQQIQVRIAFSNRQPFSGGFQ
jgi:hypothetical protein